MRFIYPQFVWRKSQKNTIYLTFDDGPIPEVTEFVLAQLKRFEAKATFFCIGGNIEKNPTIFKQIIEDKHGIGNHTFNHLNGWKTEDEIYLKNVEKCQSTIVSKQSTVFKPEIPNPKSQIKKSLFRPPYGRIKQSQAKVLLENYEIIMWDVLTGDYSTEISPENCLKKALKYTESGSIVLFHDSIKASKNIMYALPRFLEHFAERGFSFESL